uniref:Integrase catalytic domain-containing protein n=1 Tax=Biomphalaria glabrata TaxID=6526 RepID=A0A2C9JZK0_BIOGL
MADEIKQMAETCTVCQERKPMNQRETLIQHDEGNFPWEKVGADLMEVDGRQYLITVDYYSNFIEYDYLSTTTLQDVIRKLKVQFSRFGVPKMFVTYGGPQFSSNEFLRFTRRWNINQIRSDPALLELRNTPRQCTGFSPAEMCLKRSPRTLIHSTSKCLSEHVIAEKKGIYKRQVKIQYDKQARDLLKLNLGQTIYYQNPGQTRWYLGIIREQPSPRSYKIMGDNRGFYIRNRFHIRQRKTILKDTDVYDGNVLDDEKPDFF